MNLNASEYQSSVFGCWLGKNIGGTLGAPFEWRRQTNHIDFYTQDLGGEPLPNDDLDIQLLWLVALEELGVDLDTHALAKFWLLYVTPHWAEYGTAKANLRAGLLPPLSGTYGNAYKDSCGAFIRSEIWACIAPGSPQTAARYAYEDAIIDHGNGEGTYAEVFTAAIESAAFVEKDIKKLIRIGLTYIPEDCGVAGAVRLAVQCHKNHQTWQEARAEILRQYRGSAFFMNPEMVSPEDREKGFVEGKQGWDVPSNIGMLVTGLLYGEGDFDRSICTAVNCGEDTDCTGATAGALFGILHGAGSIPEKWVTPIGHKIRTACLNLGELGYFGNQLPATLEDLTSRTMRVASQVVARHNLPVEITDRPTDFSSRKDGSLLAGDQREKLYRHLNGPLFRSRFFDIGVDYGVSGPVLRSGKPATVTLQVENHYKNQAMLGLRWYTPECWQITPSRTGALLSLPQHIQPLPLTTTFQVTAGELQESTMRAVVEITQAGWPETLLVPITFLNGDLQQPE